MAEDGWRTKKQRKTQSESDVQQRLSTNRTSAVDENVLAIARYNFLMRTAPIDVTRS